MEFKKPDRPARGKPASTPSIQRVSPKPTPQPVSASHAPPLATAKNTLLASRKNIALGVLAVVTVVMLGAWPLVHQRDTDKNTPQETVANATTAPTHQTILPTGKTVDSLGGWRRVSPPGKEPVFAYSDTINGITISVSQQALPKSFQGDTSGKVAELAKQYNATSKLEANGTIIYIGVSSNGPQSVILTKKNLLVMIKSQKKIDDKAWIQYVNSLG